MKTKTRFAPSPTGYLHIGGVRTALFSWLHARKYDGEFVLRIEDTDRERSTEEAVEVILQGMQWLGLNYDEEPVYQTHRFEHYNGVIQQLLESGHAYHCYCSRERLDKLRETQMREKCKPRYDGHCRDQTPTSANTDNLADTKPVIRFRNPQSGNVVFEDSVRGPISISNEELDDLIIARSDGTPTYNFTVVIDDMDMQISHVIRGDDHINNTPRQINIFRALNAEPPQYGHVPMILAADGKRLSKRHGAVSVMQYKEQGYLPEALLNYLLRLGWSHGDQEIFSISEMIELFDIKNVNKAAATFNPEKLLWLNQHYLKTLDIDLITLRAKSYFDDAGIDLSDGPDLKDLVAVQRERSKTLLELVETSRFFYEDVKTYDEKAANKHLNAEAAEAIQSLLSAYTELSDWNVEALHQIVKDTAEQLSLKMGKVAQPLRVAVTGNTVSPSIDVTLLLIGKERVLARLQQAVEFISR